MSQKRRRNLEQHPQTEEELDLDAPIKECARFILCREGSKIPIKREEIRKHLETVCQTPKAHMNNVICGAQNLLKKVYGYKLIQVQKKDVQMLVVLSEGCESLPSTAINIHHQRILTAALTHIYMTCGPVKEDDMWNFLAEAGVMEENDHAGRKLLTHTFTKQMYLTYYKVGEGDLARNVFEWGQRATEELPKIFLLNKVAQAFEKEPSHWCEQYKEATENL